MSYTVIGESIKSAFSIKLGELFKVPTGQLDKQGNPTYNYPIRYKENITLQSFPNFQIIQTNTNITPLQTVVERAYNKSYRRVQIDYLFNIQYRIANNTEDITNLRQQLDAVGLKLLTELVDIDLEYPVHLKNSRYEIVDGILQFFTNVTVFANIGEQNDTLMDDLDLDENIDEENTNDEIEDDTEEENNTEEENDTE